MCVGDGRWYGLSRHCSIPSWCFEAVTQKFLDEVMIALNVYLWALRDGLLLGVVVFRSGIVMDQGVMSIQSDA
jgi:hypothetical protein